MNTEMTEAPSDPELPRASAPKRVINRFAATIVVVAMIVAALSLWTVIPLTWVWIGSRVSHTQAPSGGPYMVVLVGIVISIVLIAWLISRLNRLYVRITGTHDVGAIRPRWLRSMRDTPSRPENPTVLETVIVSSVLLAMVAAGLWFFLLAGSPLPNQ
jgi:hypothetical protein